MLIPQYIKNDGSLPKEMIKFPSINPFKNTALGIRPFTESVGRSSGQSTDISVSNTSFPAFADDKSLFFYKGTELTIIDRNDHKSITGLIYGSGENTFTKAIRSAVVELGISFGYNIFYLDLIIHAGHEREPIGAFKKVTSGTHGVVYLLTHFNVILKYFTEGYIMMLELAMYELINNVYQEPEKVGLPVLLGYGDGYLLTRNYTRTLRHREPDELYHKIARCIYNLHRLGIVHRDIKFSNIMVHNGNPILVDFGLSTWRIATSHRKPGTSIQTMWFRAPEVADDRNRNYPANYSSDWWSYGIILASINKMIYSPMNNNELQVCLTELFKNGDIPISVNAKVRQFLHKDPKVRMDGAKFLQVRPITDKNIVGGLPVAKNLFEMKVVSLPNIANSWIEYFTALDYLYYVTEREANDLAHLVVGGGAPDIDAAGYFSRLEGNILRLNTFSILTSRYPIEQVVFPCFVLSLNGVRFPHKDQVEWIENYFIKEKNDTHPEIEKYYFHSLSEVISFSGALKRLGHIDVESYGNVTAV